MGGSSSNTSAATAQTDNRRVIGQGATSAENSTVTTYNQSLDGQVANAAFASNNNAIANAAALIGANGAQNTALISNTTANAFSFGSNTVDTALASVNNAVSNFAALIGANNGQSAETTRQAFGFGSQALGLAGSSTQSALGLAGSSTQSALDFGARALDYSTHAQDAANASLQGESNLISTAYSDAKTQSGTTNKIMIGALVMAGLVAIAALRKNA